MKKLKFLMMAAAGCLAFVSCSDDDDNGNGNENLDNDLTGTYELSRLVAPNAQDFDSDGDTNTNLVMEGNCYNSSWISFHQDGTYEQHHSWSTMAEGGATLECDSTVSTGTYTQDGDSVTTTQTSGGIDMSATYEFDAENHTLTTTDQDGTYYGWNSVTSLFAQLTGDLQMEFTKYTENEDDNGNGQNDDDNANASAMAEILGDFNLSSYLVAEEQDLDNDGNSSSNLMLENECYGGSNITFNADGTYEETTTTNVLSNLGTELTCETTTQTGWWTRQGDEIHTHHMSGNTMVSTSFLLDSQNNTISQSNEDWQYPSFNSVTSLFAMLTGTVDLEYTHQNN